MVDEVFVTVRYQADDFVRGRRLGLLTKARDMSLVQLCVFLLVGIGGALFFAPAWLGQLVAAAGGAVIGMAALVFAYGWIKTGAEKPPDLDALVGIEVSDEGIAIKRDAGCARFRWAEFDRVTYGLGVFMLFGSSSVLIPRRALRDDQFEALRALMLAHEPEVGQAPEPIAQAAPASGRSRKAAARSAPAEEDDERDGQGDDSEHE